MRVDARVCFLSLLQHVWTSCGQQFSNPFLLGHKVCHHCHHGRSPPGTEGDEICHQSHCKHAHTVLIVDMVQNKHCGNIRGEFFLLQSISPGLVRTEFAPRLNKAADIEEGKKQYDEMVDGVRQNL